MTNPSDYSVCISGALIAVGALVAFLVSRRRRTVIQMVDAGAADPLSEGKEEWREKAQSTWRAWSRKVWMFYIGFVLLVLIGVGAWRTGPSIVKAFSPTATPTHTSLPTFTPQPSRTPTPTYWPNEVVNASFTPKGTMPATQPPQVVVTTIYQQVPVTVVVVITRIFQITVVVTATPIPTGTLIPTFTPSPTPTLTETPSPTWTPSPTLTPTETPTP